MKSILLLAAIQLPLGRAVRIHRGGNLGTIGRPETNWVGGDGAGDDTATDNRGLRLGRFAGQSGPERPRNVTE